jgi:DNA primase
MNFSSQYIRDKDEAVIVEGYLDVIMPFQSGIMNIAASSGTSLTQDQIRILKRFTKNAVMVYDGDKAGEAATLRGLDLFLQEDVRVKIVNLPKGLDPDSLIRKSGPESFAKKIAAAQNLFDYKLGLLTSRFDPGVLEQKVAIIAEMLPTLARIQNEVLKSEYIKRLSEELRCEQSAILAELNKTKIDYYEYTPQIEAEEEKHPVRPAEKMVVGIMLDDNHYAKHAMENLSLEEFIDPGIRQIVENIYEYTKRNKKINAGGLMSHTNQELTQLIAEIAATTQTMGDKERNLTDCIRSIKRENIKDKMGRIQTRINMAQGSQDEKGVDSLLKEYDTLLKEYKIWR